jgi:hypothetical protein
MRATTTNPNPSPQQLREQEVEWGSRTVDVYEKIEQIGEGTYGCVFYFLSFLPIQIDFLFTPKISQTSLQSKK